jgi:CRISPR-associated protein Cmr2
MKKYDFHAHYAFAEQHGITQAEAIDFLTGVQAEPPRQWPGLAAVTDDGARLQLLAQALASAYKERARMGQQKGKAGGLGHWIMSGKAHTYFAAQKETYLNPLKLVPAAPDLARLPEYSFAFHVIFTLAGAYLSRDDRVFYILDNPVKKEWVFKLPYIAPSQWKGALRAAIRQNNDWPNDHCHLLRLFGQSRDDEGQAGRLHFYPTFFDHIGLEVINPHDRETGAGKQPIYLESVPIDVAGTFTLLYVPFDRIGEDEPETRTQVAADLDLVATGIQAMMTIYGFGAKTSSGFGVANEQKEQIEGQLVLNHTDLQEPEVQPERLSEPIVPESVRAFREAYPDETFSDKPKAWRTKHKTTANERERYKQARADYQRYRQQFQAYEHELSEREHSNTQVSSQVVAPTTFTVTSFADLSVQATALARLLRGGEG